MTHVAAALVVVIGLWFAVRGTRRLARGLRDAVSLEVIRGIRGLVIAASAAAASFGLLTGQTGFVIVGAVFVAEELYETGIVALIIRLGDRAAAEG